jgi:GrpB-like predicted nucleotidyltransferase (UPF0157 family)
MYLIGRQQLNPAEGDHSLIASMFERLPEEARHTGDVTRFIGFETCGNGTAAGQEKVTGTFCRNGPSGASHKRCLSPFPDLSPSPDRLRFFGIEVDAVETIPAGLIAWDFGDASWSVWREDDGRKSLLWQEDIRWKWRETTRTDPGKTIGEFAARGAAEWWSDGFRGDRTFVLFAHLFFDCRKRKFRDDVLLADYDPTWPEQYEQMAGWLRDRLGPDVALRIEHYGSTAIPNMPAKPIIDILVEIPSSDEGRKRALSVLSDETWEYWSYWDHIVFFKRKELMGERTHHVHLAPRGHDIWRGLLLRDYLRSHPRDAARYAELKRQLAETYRTDRERYTQMKTTFVEEICRRA